VGLVLRRRRRPPQCETCGFELSSPLADCTYCIAEANIRAAAVRPRAAAPSAPPQTLVPTTAKPARVADQTLETKWGRAGDTVERRPPLALVNEIGRHAATGTDGAPRASAPAPLSEAALARMNNTEEYLEKTLTLTERPVLVITSGPGSGRVFSLSAEMTTCLGRAKLNDIVLEDVSVSSEHCRIRPEDGGFVLHDLRSTNGTYINDKRIATEYLSAGDVITVGETHLLFRMDHQRES
jgi:hypothetical protein